MVVIKWTEDARSDFEDIIAYLSRSSVQYAGAFHNKVQDAIDILTRFPDMGRLVPESDEKVDREIFIQKYRLIYRFDEKEQIIYIMMLIHGSRLLRFKK